MLLGRDQFLKAPIKLCQSSGEIGAWRMSGDSMPLKPPVAIALWNLIWSHGHLSSRKNIGPANQPQNGNQNYNSVQNLFSVGYEMFPLTLTCYSKGFASFLPNMKISHSVQRKKPTSGAACFESLTCCMHCPTRGSAKVSCIARASIRTIKRSNNSYSDAGK